MLANEQVIDGRCERCGAEVTKRELTQWYFKITDYAQELLDDLDDLAPTWPERVITAQRNWIGRSEGAHVTLPGRRGSTTSRSTVYTTRPDTLFGATFMVVAADAALAGELVTDEQRPAYDAYLEEVRKASDIDRLSTDRPEDRCLPGRPRDQPGDRRSRSRCTPPTTCWPTTAPARSWPCPARTSATGTSRQVFDLPIVRTVQPPEGWEGEAFTGDGPGRELAQRLDRRWTAWASTRPSARSSTGWRPRASARGAVNFRLRDWLLSRQRYWGAPIPIIHCPNDGEVPVPEDQLPVVLPELRGARPDAEGRLAAGRRRPTGSTSSARRCGGPAKRDSDTMDTFVDSSWYFLRYCSPHDDTQAFDAELANLWGPCDIYIGGVEHAVLHLLYARFFTKVLRDMGLLEFGEPFSAQLNQGIVINEGAKMSKSKGNGVRLGEQLSAYGVDAVRLTLVFAGPPEDDIDWADMSPERVAAVPAARLAAER